MKGRKGKKGRFNGHAGYVHQQKFTWGIYNETERKRPNFWSSRQRRSVVQNVPQPTDKRQRTLRISRHRKGDASSEFPHSMSTDRRKIRNLTDRDVIEYGDKDSEND